MPGVLFLGGGRSTATPRHIARRITRGRRRGRLLDRIGVLALIGVLGLAAGRHGHRRKGDEQYGSHGNLHAQFPALVTLAGQVSGAQALVDAAGDAKPAALAIITAWYTGTVGKGVHAVTVSYRDALMQRCVDDGLSPPTYVQGGPAWWTAAPPAPIRAHA